jgi:hypothetical protein
MAKLVFDELKNALPKHGFTLPPSSRAYPQKGIEERAHVTCH